MVEDVILQCYKGHNIYYSLKESDYNKIYILLNNEQLECNNYFNAKELIDLIEDNELLNLEVYVNNALINIFNLSDSDMKKEIKNGNVVGEIKEKTDPDGGTYESTFYLKCLVMYSNEKVTIYKSISTNRYGFFFESWESIHKNKLLFFNSDFPQHIQKIVDNVNLINQKKKEIKKLQKINDRLIMNTRFFKVEHSSLIE